MSSEPTVARTGMVGIADRGRNVSFGGAQERAAAQQG
jgi:hypothetical protein